MTSDPPKTIAIVMARWPFRVGGLTLLLLLCSLACYSQTNVIWAARDKYNIDVKHTALGLPHWLVINRWEVRGTPPPLYQLPDGGVYQRGWHVDPMRLVVAALLCAVTAALLAWATSVVPPPDAYWPGISSAASSALGSAVPSARAAARGLSSRSRARGAGFARPAMAGTWRRPPRTLSIM